MAEEKQKIKNFSKSELSFPTPNLLTMQKDSWENLVAAYRDINTRKSNRLNSEAGLVLVKKPVGPRPVPLALTVKGVYLPDHQWF